MAAAQPFISGAISKTINMPNDATVDDCKAAYILSWRLALKANALYRDGRKLSQPLHSQLIADEEDEDDTPSRRRPSSVRPRRAPRRLAEKVVEKIVERITVLRERERLPDAAQGLHPEGRGRRPQGLSAHRRIRRRPAGRDLRRHAQGRRGAALACSTISPSRSRSACNTACRWRNMSTPSRSRGSSRPARCRATTRSNTRPRSSTTCSASWRCHYLERFDLAHVDPSETGGFDALGKGVEEGRPAPATNYVSRGLTRSRTDRLSVVSGASPSPCGGGWRAQRAGWGQRDRPAFRRRHRAQSRAGSETLAGREARSAQRKRRAAARQGRGFRKRAEARAKGYEGEACGECGNFTLVRNGTCMKCDTCGSTTGCGLTAPIKMMEWERAATAARFLMRWVMPINESSVM